LTVPGAFGNVRRLTRRFPMSVLKSLVYVVVLIFSLLLLMVRYVAA
jgi:hypothetical protein